MAQCGNCHILFKKKSAIERHLPACIISTQPKGDEFVVYSCDKQSDLCKLQPTSYHKIECAKEFEINIPGIFPQIFVNKSTGQYPVFPYFSEMKRTHRNIPRCC